MTMAFRLTIKLTKTDDNIWWLVQQPRDEKMRQLDEHFANPLIGIDLQACEHDAKNFTIVKEFSSKDDANAWMLYFFKDSQDYVVEHFSFVAQQHHTGWTESVDLVEI